MPFYISIIILLLSILGIVLSTIFVKKKGAKIALTVVLSAIALAMLVYTILTVIFVYSVANREPDMGADDYVVAEAHDRVDELIGLAKDELERQPITLDPATAYVSFPFERESSYDTLTDSQKKLYDDILPKIAGLEDFEYSAEEYGYDTLDDLLIAAIALCEDYPLYDMYHNIIDVIGDDDVTTVALRSYYFMPGDSSHEVTTSEEKEALRHEISVFEAECSLIVNAIPEDAYTYDKYRFLAAYISLRTSYDYDAVGGYQIGGIYGSIEGGYSICQGYSEGFRYLCSLADLWCCMVSGQSRGESHAWNLVKLEEGTYHIDITWSDNGINYPGDEGWYEYFMLTQDEILMDHEIDDGTVATGGVFDKPFPTFG